MANQVITKTLLLLDVARAFELAMGKRRTALRAGDGDKHIYIESIDLRTKPADEARVLASRVGRQLADAAMRLRLKTFFYPPRPLSAAWDTIVREPSFAIRLVESWRPGLNQIVFVFDMFGSQRKAA